MVAVVVRRADLADAAALALVGRATFLETFAGTHSGADILAHGEKHHSPEAYAAWLADPRCDLWLAEAMPGAAPVGFALMTPAELPVSDPRPDDLELKRIYLLHRFQGGGQGRALMDVAIARARERGSRRLLLGVWTQNTGALAFYAHLGFTRVGERRFRVGEMECQDHLLGLTL